eukprot:scaffold58374_cov57-Phaeocystis_antarctica.AAC.1
MAACADPAANSTGSFKHLYDAASQGIKEKIEAIVKGAYGGEGASYSEAAEARIAQYERDPSLRVLPICMSKTQYSLTDLEPSPNPYPNPNPSPYPNPNPNPNPNPHSS